MRNYKRFQRLSSTNKFKKEKNIAFKFYHEIYFILLELFIKGNKQVLFIIIKLPDDEGSKRSFKNIQNSFNRFKEL